jgi:streptogramin lyase
MSPSRFVLNVRLCLAVLGLCCVIGGAATRVLAATEVVVRPPSVPRAVRGAMGRDGNLWFTEATSNSIVRLTPGGAFTAFAVPGASSLNAITMGPDGALWFTDTASSQIGRINVAGTISLFPLAPGNYAVDIASGSDGNLWFTEANIPTIPMFSWPGCTGGGSIRVLPQPGHLARVTTHGLITEFAGPQDLTSITSGPDGNLWFIETSGYYGYNGVIAKVSTSGVRLGTFSLNTPVMSLASGPDGNLWMTGFAIGPCYAPDKPVVIKMAPAGNILFEEPAPFSFGRITAGPDGNMWLMHPGGLTKITPNGTLTEYPMNLPSYLDLTAGSGGTLWLVPGPIDSDLITEVATSGTVAGQFRFVSASRPSVPSYIAPGPNGLWFTDPTNNLVGRIVSGDQSFFRAPASQSIASGTSAVVFVENSGAVGSLDAVGNLSGSPAAASGSGITLGPDGNVWFVEKGKIGRTNPGAANTEFDAPAAFGEIISGPDGNLWFTEDDFSTHQAIDAITPSGIITRYSLTCHPTGHLAPGPDGNIWFTASAGPGVGYVLKITPGGALTSYPTGGEIPSSITAGTDGALWFAKTPAGGTVSSEIGRITTDGVLTAVSPHASGGIFQLVTSEDLWFTEPKVSRIGHIRAIAGTPVAVNASENTPFTDVIVATFVNGTVYGAGSVTDYAATISWGDGASGTGTIVSFPYCCVPFAVEGSHSYALTGSYPITVMLHDNVNNADYTFAPGTVTVADAPLSPGTTVLPSGNCVEGADCRLTLASFTDADPKPTLSNYTTSIDWGDGTTATSLGLVAPCGAEFCVTISHLYTEEGSYNTKVTVTDIGGSSVNLTGISVNVSDAPLTAYSGTPASPHGVPFTEVIATFKDANSYAAAGDFTASIDWGDSTSSAGVITVNNHRGFDVTGTHTYTDPGPHTAKVTINDVGGSTASASSVVADDFPIAATEKNFHVRIGKPFTAILGSFTTDPSVNSGDLSATIDWGDGTPPETGVILSKGNGVFTVQGSHTYMKVFGKNVTVQMNHTAGATGIASDAVHLWPKTAP